MADGQASKHIVDAPIDRYASAMKASTKKLIAAIRSDKVAVVRELLEAGADPNTSNSSGEPLLNGSRNPAVVELLLKAGADPNVVPKDWNPPLHLAAANGQVRLARLLLEHGANIDLRSKEGNTPLIVAADRAQTEMVKLLLSSGSEVNLANAEGDRAIHRICKSHSLAAAKIVALLLQAGADPDSRGAERATPLKGACYFRNLPVVQLLLKSGADVNAKDEFGCTPILSAIRIEDAKIVALLLKSGADLSLRVSKKHMNRSIAGRSLAEIAEESSKAVRTLVTKAKSKAAGSSLNC